MIIAKSQLMNNSLMTLTYTHECTKSKSYIMRVTKFMFKITNKHKYDHYRKNTRNINYSKTLNVYIIFDKIVHSIKDLNYIIHKFCIRTLKSNIIINIII